MVDGEDEGETMSGPQPTRHFNRRARWASIVAATVLAAGGCASPRPPDATTRTVVASDASVHSGSPVDAAIAVALVDARTATSPDSDVVLVFPRATLEPGAYDWELIRFSNEAWVGKPSSDSACDPRNGPPMPGHECLGKVREIAALLKTTDFRDGKLLLRVDRGTEALVTVDWYASIIDEKGHPLTPWSHPVQVRSGSSVITLQRHSGIATDSERTRVILIPRLPKENR